MKQDLHRKRFLFPKSVEIIVIVLLLCICRGELFSEEREIILADFETRVPCSDAGNTIGFREKDWLRATTVEGGAEGTTKSSLFKIRPSRNDTSVEKDIFFQGKVRRLYLATRSTMYAEDGPNALSFWVKLKPDSVLIDHKGENNTFGVWTYHWEFGDPYVGGKSNKGLATDSMMHGYSNFSFSEKAAGKWVKVILTPSAFQQSRYYYHFYAARGTTGNLKFFPSLRQLQFHIFPKITKEQEIQIDQLKLVYLPPTAIFEEDFFNTKVSKDIGDFEIPVVIKNPMDRDRRYRVFISSFLGVHRNVLYGAHTLTDSFSPPRMMQAEAGGEGGTGVVELIDERGDSIIQKQKEIFIPARGIWKGKLIHHIRPEMIGPVRRIGYENYIFLVRRDTLTTSVIIWDPYDKTVREIEHIKVFPSNADDGNHLPPPGFPEQKRPPGGWRSEDIPINQVGGYFVSVIQLTE